jgi:multisubunit Na+/H+ antiporter MnhB subunit
VQVGLLHVIIGYLAIRIALGTGGGSADQSGALAALSAKPGGIFALWAAAIALLIMALWRLAETALGRSTEPKSQGTMPEILDRAKAFALAVVYLAFAYSALGFARSAGKSTGHQNSALSARLMQSASGTVVLVVGGVIIVAVGGYHIYKGASRNFLDDLKGTSSDLVRRLGVIGYIAKGLAIAGAGVLVIIAASLFSARQSHRTRRGAENTWRSTLRSDTSDPRQRGNHYLRSLQLRHGPVRQNVANPTSIFMDNDAQVVLDDVKDSAHGFLPLSAPFDSHRSSTRRPHLEESFHGALNRQAVLIGDPICSHVVYHRAR